MQYCSLHFIYTLSTVWVSWPVIIYICCSITCIHNQLYAKIRVRTCLWWVLCVKINTQNRNICINHISFLLVGRLFIYYYYIIVHNVGMICDNIHRRHVYVALLLWSNDIIAKTPHITDFGVNYTHLNVQSSG